MDSSTAPEVISDMVKPLIALLCRQQIMATARMRMLAARLRRLPSPFPTPEMPPQELRRPGPSLVGSFEEFLQLRDFCT